MQERSEITCSGGTLSNKQTCVLRDWVSYGPCLEEIYTTSEILSVAACMTEDAERQQYNCVHE